MTIEYVSHSAGEIRTAPFESATDRNLFFQCLLDRPDEYTILGLGI